MLLLLTEEKDAERYFKVTVVKNIKYNSDNIINDNTSACKREKNMFKKKVSCSAPKCSILNYDIYDYDYDMKS